MQLANQFNLPSPNAVEDRAGLPSGIKQDHEGWLSAWPGWRAPKSVGRVTCCTLHKLMKTVRFFPRAHTLFLRRVCCTTVCRRVRCKWSNFNASRCFHRLFWIFYRSVAVCGHYKLPVVLCECQLDVLVETTTIDRSLWTRRRAVVEKRTLPDFAEDLKSRADLERGWCRTIEHWGSS